MTDFDRVESELITLMEIVQPELSIVDLIREFIDHNEFGLALEFVGFGMYYVDRVPSDDEVVRFRRIAEAMSQDADSYLLKAREHASADARRRNESGGAPPSR